MVMLTLDKARDGMVLADDSQGRSGQVLLPSGTTLTARHLQLLSANGIDEVSIRETANEDTTPAAPLSPEEVEAHLADRFRDSDAAHPVIQELQRICRARLLEPHKK